MNFEPELNLMKQKIAVAEKSVDALISSARSPAKFNTLVDSVMQNMEVACIELRRIAEQIRPREDDSSAISGQTAKTIYGSITGTSEIFV